MSKRKSNSKEATPPSDRRKLQDSIADEWAYFDYYNYPYYYDMCDGWQCVCCDNSKTTIEYLIEYNVK